MRVLFQALEPLLSFDVTGGKSWRRPVDRQRHLTGRANAAAVSALETCVACNGRTLVPRGLPVEKRRHYIEGCGQLCPTCHAADASRD